MIDTKLKKSKITKIIDKFVEKYLFNHISANQMTLIGLILGITSSILIVISEIINWNAIVQKIIFIIAVIIMVISFGADIFDGALARMKKPTIFGGIFDIFSDRTVEISILIAIIFIDPVNLLWPGVFSLSSIVICITIFLLIGGAVNESQIEQMDEKKKVIFYASGLMERTETFIFLFSMLVFDFSIVRIILMWIFAVLVFITAFQRLYHAYKLFYKSD
ncbi:MAG: CDP-alcohol phosphatidyltransferase family protein [Promethearchaeota archaeon]